MALTVRTNGSGSSNIIQASWWNDYYNLLTGAMQDQEVTINNVLILHAIGAAPASACSGSLAAGTNLGTGLYVYCYTYANADGETTRSPTFSITTTSGNQKVNLTGITTGPTGTTARNIYRTAVGGGATYKFVATISDNSTTTYTDTVPDGSLGSKIVGADASFGGSLIIRDSNSASQAQIFSDGAAYFNGTLFANNGIKLITNGISRIAAATNLTVTTTATFFNHNLGVVPDAVFLTIRSGSTTAHQCYYDPNTMTATQVKLQADGSITVDMLSIKF